MCVCKYTAKDEFSTFLIIIKVVRPYSGHAQVCVELKRERQRVDKDEKMLMMEKEKKEEGKKCGSLMPRS